MDFLGYKYTRSRFKAQKISTSSNPLIDPTVYQSDSQKSLIRYRTEMLKIFVIAATVACASAYYNHGAAVNPSYYGNYGSAVASLPVNGHHGNIYASGYGSYGGGSSHTKIIEATYPGAVHKSASYAATNPTGYVGAGYAHGSISHAVAPAATYVHAPSAVAVHNTPVPYNHGPVAIAARAPVAYNHGPAATYADSRYAVTEGPGTYVAHSRYATAGAPALSYSHARYPFAGTSGPAYANALSADHGIQKIAYDQAVSHMGYQSHAAQSYAW